MLELRLQALHTIASGGNELANITDTQNTLLAMIQTVIVEFLGKLGEEPLNEKASKHILRVCTEQMTPHLNGLCVLFCLRGNFV